jgi:hypothetical protein
MDTGNRDRACSFGNRDRVHVGLRAPAREQTERANRHLDSITDSVGYYNSRVVIKRASQLIELLPTTSGEQFFSAIQ